MQKATQALKSLKKSNFWALPKKGCKASYLNYSKQSREKFSIDLAGLSESRSLLSILACSI